MRDDVVAFQDEDGDETWFILAPADDSLDTWVRCPADSVREVEP